jgi:DNA modification methylase
MEINKIHCGDCLEVIKELEDNSIDLVVTSPPYEDFNGAGYSGKTKDILFLKLYSEFFDKFMGEVFRILKPNGQFFLNLKNKTLKKNLLTTSWIEFTESFRKFNFKSFIIWKYAGSFDSSYCRFHNDYEVIYHLSKGDNIVLNIDKEEKDPLTSVWYIPHYISKRLHPVQMPKKVAEKIIKVSSNEGDIILDPFMGSGTTGVACANTGRKFIGIELSPEYCEIANKRIQQTLNLTLKDKQNKESLRGEDIK